MKKTKKYLFVLLLASLAGCSLFENDLTDGKPRMSTGRSGSIADSVKFIKSPDEPAAPEATFDTTVFVSAIRCLSGYDWRRDVDYGCADAQLLLYKNGEEILCIPAGDGRNVSVAPDMHHILDGHLYTEYCDYSKTVIGCDGTDLFTFTGRELLKGLLVQGEDIYTLSERVSSGGFIFRKNGQEIISQKKGSVFGSFDDPSYGTNGALYSDKGEICFAYKNQQSCFLVRGGVATSVSGVGITDIKSVGGKNVSVGVSALRHRWKDARIWRLGGSFLVSGESADEGENGVFRVVDESTGNETTFKMPGAIVYCSNGVSKVLDRDTMEKNNYCFSSRCATLIGDDLVTLNTPREEGTPYMSSGGKKILFEDLNGYLTGVVATVSLTNGAPLSPRKPI